MDIVTHAMMGVIVASPWLQTHPEAATAFMFGSVLPDLDAFSRVLGRRAFMRAHQTYSHAYPVIAGLGLAVWAGLQAAEIHAPYAALALALGAAFHSTLDWTNTYGITLLAPFSRRRFCREWVFFVDASVIAACAVALGAIAWRTRAAQPIGAGPAAGFAAFCAAYWALKIALRARAARLAPEGTLALLPSALSPWRFYGCAPEGDDGPGVRIFRVDARSGALDREQRVSVLDADYAATLQALPEFRAMRALSPAYHVVEATPQEDGEVHVLCRDLRTRNFSTRFGELEAVVHGDAARLVQFHV